MNLHRAISPTQAVDILWKNGVKISERTLRSKARSIGAYREVGKAMFFLPEDLDRIIEPCSNSSKETTRPTGLRVGRSTVGASKKALDVVTKMKRGKS